MHENRAPQKIEEFLNTEFEWNFTAGECHFLVQLLALLVQENPLFVTNQQGEKERLNYQSIRTAVLLNEKLSRLLQQKAQEASVAMGEVPGSERVQ